MPYLKEVAPSVRLRLCVTHVSRDASQAVQSILAPEGNVIGVLCMQTFNQSSRVFPASSPRSPQQKTTWLRQPPALRARRQSARPARKPTARWSSRAPRSWVSFTSRSRSWRQTLPRRIWRSCALPFSPCPIPFHLSRLLPCGARPLWPLTAVTLVQKHSRELCASLCVVEHPEMSVSTTSRSSFHVPAKKLACAD